MCEFVSWIEKDGTVLFLTHADVYDTVRGKELQAFCKTKQDYVGHGVIRFFFELSETSGINKECTNFSSPNNFPTEIADAIKAGKMWGFGNPQGLLGKVALAKYNKVCNPARAKYDKVCYPALAKYNKVCDAARAEYDKVCNPARAKYNKVCDAARAEYDKVCNAAWAEYSKVYNAAWAEYDKVCNAAFRTLFAIKKNREKVWQ
jgi:hypothetical protein